MTPREQMILLKLAVHLSEQGAAPKDADIERELAALLKARPDTPYLLLQRCMTLTAQLEEAETRLAESRRTLTPFGAGSYAVQGLDDYKIQRHDMRSAASQQGGLRDLLGEWASTTLLSELVDESPPNKNRRHN